MANLDPEEERLLAEAMFDTAGEDLSGPALEFVEETGEVNGEDNVPKSKIQFPIRRRKSSRNRKIFCIATFLVVVSGALAVTYFLLKTKTFSFELKLQKGQVLRYKLSQESSFEGVEQVHSNFDEDVLVEVVNKTGSQCWMKVWLKTLPNLKTQRSTFLVNIKLGSQSAMNTEGERRLKVFTRSNQNNRSVDYFVWNLLTQLFPVVKIDLFEVILSQITTRKHELRIQDSKFFPGEITMKQNIRMSKEHVLVTSSVDPEGFASFSSSKSSNPLPDVAFTYEEDTAISKNTGMIDTSNMELSAKIPLYGDRQQESGKTLVMRFKSSLRFIKEESSTPNQNKPETSTHPFVEMPETSTPTKATLQYISPSDKEYDETANLVDKVKKLLNFTRFHGTDGYEYKPRKDLEEFAKSFHKIVKPGVETNFAEVEANGTDPLHVRDEMNQRKTPEKNSGNRHENIDDDDDDNYSRDDDAPYDDDYDDDDEHGRRWNRFGQAVPMSPDEDEYYNDDKNNGPPRYTGGEPTRKNEPDAPRALYKHVGNPGQGATHDKATPDGAMDEKVNKGKKGDLLQQKNEHKQATTDRFTEAHQESTKQGSRKAAKTSKKSHQATKTQKDGKKKPKVNEKKNGQITNGSGTLATPAPQQEEHSFFDRIFDGDDDNDDDDAGDKKDNDFKFSHLIPFSFSSHFPFVHFKWPNIDSRKRRSLEPNEQQNVHREVIHQNKSDFIRQNQTEVIHRYKRDVIHRNKSDAIHRYKRDGIRPNKRDVIHQNKSDVIYRYKRDVIHRDKRRLYDDDDYDDDDYSDRDLAAIMDIISPGSIKEHPKQTSHVFQRKILGLTVSGELEHEVKVSTSTNSAQWVIRLSLLLSVDKHKFKVLEKTITMKEIEERFVKNSKPKYEYGTVHAGTLVLCARLHYIESICVELQLGFVLHVSHTIESLTKEYPIELSIFFKQLAKVDVTLSSHMTSLLGSYGVYGQGPLFGAKIPLEIRFSELKNAAQWCSVANFKSKVGHFYEKWKDLSQWSCPMEKAVETGSICKGLNRNTTRMRKPTRKLWYKVASTKKLHFLNNC